MCQPWPEHVAGAWHLRCMCLGEATVAEHGSSVVGGRLAAPNRVTPYLTLTSKTGVLSSTRSTYGQ